MTQLQLLPLSTLAQEERAAVRYQQRHGLCIHFEFVGKRCAGCDAEVAAIVESECTTRCTARCRGATEERCRCKCAGVRHGTAVQGRLF